MKKISIISIKRRILLDNIPGYINKLYSNLKDNLPLIKQIFEEQNVAGHLFAALLIAQNVRWQPKDRFYRRPIDCLPSIKEKIDKALSKLKIASPNLDEISNALMEYHMLKEEEMTAWKEMLVQN